TTLAANQHVAQSGQIVKFSFNFKVPDTTLVGTYREFVQPVLEGAVKWDIGAVGYYDVSVLSTYKATFNALSSYPTTTAGTIVSVWVKYQNTGNQAWNDSSIGGGGSYIDLVATSPLGRKSAFSAAWPSQTQIANQFTAVYTSDGTTLAASQHTA